MAGAEAEREIIEEPFGGDDDDRSQIALMLEEIDEADREARLRRFARMLVRRHRALIEHVAQALSTERTLSREAIDGMMPKGALITSRPVSQLYLDMMRSRTPQK